MSHVVTLSDAAFHTLEAIASEQGQTPEALIEAWAAQQAQTRRSADRDPHTDPHYENYEEFFRGLGMSEEEIRQAKEAAADNADV
jgi:DNA/RNA-binding domain of Phe-tRNA-synthetase-like protein